MLFKTKLLINDEVKELLDERYDWIVNLFSEEYLVKKNNIEPIEIFPEKYKQDENSFETIAKNICNKMDVNFNNINFELTVNDQAIRSIKGFVHNKVEGSKFGGYYKETDGSASIYIEENNLESPISLVSTIAHEIAHYKLLYELKTDEHDEYLTDMVPMFFGFGLYTSSSVNVLENYNTIIGSGWRQKRLGYLTEYMHGYLLAKWMLMTNGKYKDFAIELKPNVFQSYKNTLKVMNKW